MIIFNNAIRWNLVYLIIKRVFKLRDAIDFMIKRSVEKKQKSLSKEDKFLNDDWIIFSRTAEILKPFYTFTVRMQSRASRGGRGSLWEVLPTLEFLMGILENKAVEYGKDLTEFRRRKDPETLKQIDIDLPDY